MGQSDHSSQETSMSRFWRHFISNGADSGQDPNYFAPEPTEREALDAYSNVVVDVAEACAPPWSIWRRSRPAGRLWLRRPLHA